MVYIDHQTGITFMQELVDLVHHDQEIRPVSTNYSSLVTDLELPDVHPSVRILVNFQEYILAGFDIKRAYDIKISNRATIFGLLVAFAFSGFRDIHITEQIGKIGITRLDDRSIAHGMLPPLLVCLGP